MHANNTHLDGIFFFKRAIFSVTNLQVYSIPNKLIILHGRIWGKLHSKANHVALIPKRICRKMIILKQNRCRRDQILVSSMPHSSFIRSISFITPSSCTKQQGKKKGNNTNYHLFLIFSNWNKVEESIEKENEYLDNLTQKVITIPLQWFWFNYVNHVLKKKLNK